MSARLGSFLIGVGAFGLLTAVVIGLFGWLLVGAAADDVEALLDLSGETLASAASTLRVADVALGSAEDGVATGTVVAEDAAQTLRRVTTVTSDLTLLATDKVPNAIESVRSAIPPLAATAGVIDDVMRAASFLGVEYDPARPLEASILDLDSQMEEIPALLRAQTETLTALQQDLSEFADRTDDVTIQLDGLRASIAQSRSLVERYEASVSDGTVLVEEARQALPTQRGWARAAVVALTLALASSQAATFSLGWWLRRQRLEQAVNSVIVEAVRA